MIDHIYLPVSDLKRSSECYKKGLEPLGIDMPYKGDQPPMRGFAINNIPGRALDRDRPGNAADWTARRDCFGGSVPCFGRKQLHHGGVGP